MGNGSINDLGTEFGKPDYTKMMNAHYSTPEAIRDSAAKLDCYPLDIDRRTMEYGQYQPILVPFHYWPGKAAAAWRSTVGAMRMHLMEQDNADPVWPGDLAPAPKTRCGLLDEMIRRCFNAYIPFIIIVEMQGSTDTFKDTHLIKRTWKWADGSTEGKGDFLPPSKLEITIVCPYIPMQGAIKPSR